MRSILFALIFISTSLWAQVNLDSLERLVKTVKGRDKVLILTDLCWYYGASNPTKAEKFGNEAVSLSKQIKNDTLLAQSYNDLGSFFLRIGEYDKAQDHYNLAISIREILKDSMGLASLYSKMAVIEESKGNYPKALEMDFKVLKIFESTNENKVAIATLYGNISVIHLNINQDEDAVKFNDKAFKIANELGDDQLKSNLLVTYANIYKKQNKLEKALTYYKDALSYFKSANNLNSVAVIINNISSIYESQNKVDSAIFYYKQALKIRYQLQDKKGIMSTKSNLALMYLLKNKTELSIQFAMEALNLSFELETKEYTKSIYSTLSKAYFKSGNILSAYNYQVKYSVIVDSIYTTESLKQINEMSAKYESEVKEKEIALLQKDKQLQQLEVGRLKTIRNVVITGLIIIIIFSLILINRFVLIKRQKSVIEKQKELVEEKQKEILDSIRYAKRIQDAMLTSRQYIERNLKRLKN